MSWWSKYEKEVFRISTGKALGISKQCGFRDRFDVPNSGRWRKLLIMVGRYTILLYKEPHSSNSWSNYHSAHSLRCYAVSLSIFDDESTTYISADYLATTLFALIRRWIVADILFSTKFLSGFPRGFRSSCCLVCRKNGQQRSGVIVLGRAIHSTQLDKALAANKVQYPSFRSLSTLHWFSSFYFPSFN